MKQTETVEGFVLVDLPILVQTTFLDTNTETVTVPSRVLSVDCHNYLPLSSVSSGDEFGGNTNALVFLSFVVRLKTPLYGL